MKKRAGPIFWLSITILLGVALIPYLWLVLTSFKYRTDILVSPPRVLVGLTVDNYSIILKEKGFGDYLINSLIVGLSSTILAVSIGTLAAYGFSKFRIPAGNHLFFYILSTRLGPPVAYALPMYLLFFKLGLLSINAGVIIAHATFNLVLVVWMMKSFFDEAPHEVEEAAYLDGCSHFQVLWKIALPMALPGLATVAIFVLLFSWNELLFALLLSAGQMRTITVMIPSLVMHTGSLWGEVAAASVLQTIPVLGFTFLMQKHLVRGLTFGAVKG